MHDCFWCDKTFENKQQIKVHFIVIHYDLKRVQDHGEPFNCECFECGKGFNSKMD